LYLDDKDTIVKTVQNILTQEQNGEISPINEYIRHILKAFVYFINKTLSSNRFRFCEDIEEIKKDIILEEVFETVKNKPIEASR